MPFSEFPSLLCLVADYHVPDVLHKCAHGPQESPCYHYPLGSGLSQQDPHCDRFAPQHIDPYGHHLYRQRVGAAGAMSAIQRRIGRDLVHAEGAVQARVASLAVAVEPIQPVPVAVAAGAAQTVPAIGARRVLTSCRCQAAALVDVALALHIAVSPAVAVAAGAA